MPQGTQIGGSRLFASGKQDTGVHFMQELLHDIHQGQSEQQADKPELLRIFQAIKQYRRRPKNKHGGVPVTRIGQAV